MNPTRGQIKALLPNCRLFGGSTVVISIRAIASVLYREVVLLWEGPLWEVPQYTVTVLSKKKIV